MIQQTEWKKRREELGLTTKQVADRMDMARWLYERLECQFPEPPTQTMLERFDKLFGGDGAAPTPWSIDPDMPTMILDAPLKESREIIAQVSTTPNARKIVRAVNNHVRLLTALKGLRKFKHAYDCAPPGEGWRSNEFVAAIHAADCAIVAAERD